MACFLAPAGAAVITTSLKKKIPSKYHLDWLNMMLWGGFIVLVIDHIFSGELVPYPPFLTAMENPADTVVMLEELSKIGSIMVLSIVLVWVLMVVISNKVLKKRAVV